MSREDALSEYLEQPFMEEDLVEYVRKRFELSKEDFEAVLQLPRKYYTDYATYKKRFERLRPLFYILAKANLVPMSFYLKYCFPAKAPL